MFKDIEDVMRYTYFLASKSPDPSSQTSAIIINHRFEVYGVGINEFPDGVNYEPSRWERPLKYVYIEHAERNAIYDSAKYGCFNGTVGLTMVSPWAACADCARGIIQSGIKKLVTQRHGPNPPHWEESIALADGMLIEAGVEIEIMPPISGCVKILRNGELWQP